jgi:hypothetical protein
VEKVDFIITNITSDTRIMATFAPAADAAFDVRLGTLTDHNLVFRGDDYELRASSLRANAATFLGEANFVYSFTISFGGLYTVFARCRHIRQNKRFDSYQTN